MERMKNGPLMLGQVVPALSFAVVLVYLAVGCTGDLGVELPGEETMELPGEETMETVQGWIPGQEPECEFIMPMELGSKWASYVWFGVGADHVRQDSGWVQIGTVERNADGFFPEMQEEDSLYPNVVRADCDMKNTGAISWIVFEPITVRGQPHPQFDHVRGHPSTKIDHAWFFTWWEDVDSAGVHPPYGPIGINALLFIGNESGRDSQGGRERGYACGGVCKFADYFPFNVMNDTTGTRSHATYAMTNCSENPRTGELTCLGGGFRGLP